MEFKTPHIHLLTQETYIVKEWSYSTDGCADSITKSVVVDTLPAVTNSPLIKVICSRDATGITLTSSLSNSTFSYTATSKYGTTTGYAGGTGSTINQTLINTVNTAIPSPTLLHHIMAVATGIRPNTG